MAPPTYTALIHVVKRTTCEFGEAGFSVWNEGGGAVLTYHDYKDESRTRDWRSANGRQRGEQGDDYIVAGRKRNALGDSHESDSHREVQGGSASPRSASEGAQESTKSRCVSHPSMFISTPRGTTNLVTNSGTFCSIQHSIVTGSVAAELPDPQASVHAGAILNKNANGFSLTTRR